MKYLTSTAAAMGLALAVAAPVHAANVNANNLVNVNVANVANDIAKDLDVNVESVQALNNVSVPVGIAANVCDVDANVLAQDKGSDGATCDATTTNKQLNSAVQEKLGKTTQ